MSDDKVIELADRLSQIRKGDIVTEDSAALEFTRRYRNELLFDHHRGLWFRWVGTHWQCERTKLAFDFARLLVRDLSVTVATGKTSFAGGVERFARADRAHAVTSDDWDTDQFLLGTPGDTADLRTGLLRPASPADRITKITGVTPSHTADCPRFIQFLKESTGDDAETIRFIQQFSGYCLTGSTAEHAMVFVYGDGRNGKTVFLNTLSRILGDYALTAAMETFTASKHEQHSTDIAMLRGARLVTAAETEQGRHFAENKLKRLTGGDPVTARFMHCDFFTYTPRFKLWLIGNHQPNLHNVDAAIRARLYMIPFIRTPANPDKLLESKLMAEGPGILRWMIEGCLDWQQNGLIPSKTVSSATEEYFAAQDTKTLWLNEHCDVEPGNEFKTATAKELFKSWSEFATGVGEPVGSQKALGAWLDRKFARGRATGGGRIYRGLRINFVQSKADASNY